MTTKQRVLTALYALCGVSILIGGLDLTNILPLVDDVTAKWLTLIPAAFVTLGKIVTLAGDLLDNGVLDNSFKVQVIASLLAPAFLLIPSCAFSTGTLSYSDSRYEVTVKSAADGSKEYHYLEIATSREYRAIKSQSGKWSIEALDPSTGTWLKYESDSKSPSLNLPYVPVEAEASNTLT